jgi:hypothetical protein
MNELSREIVKRCEAIEEAYEFMLAYAGQGLVQEAVTGSGAAIREHLRRIGSAIEGLDDLFRRAAALEQLPGTTELKAFLPTLARDGEASRAAVRLVLAQTAISSQLIDNLNASIHLRALLTDLFLLGEIIRSQTGSPA